MSASIRRFIREKEEMVIYVYFSLNIERFLD